MGDLSRNFSEEEFACHCGCERVEVHGDLVHGLQRMRDQHGGRIDITSGFRCAYWNEAQGGKDDSAHLGGFAADIAVYNSEERFSLIKEAIYAGFTRIGVGKTFIHVDVDTTKPQSVVWVY